MKKLEINQKWWNKLLPEGLPYPTSTLISGPGGSGKPLIGFAFVHDWLKAGGNVIFIPLQYPDTAFVDKSLKQLYDMDLADYIDSTTYIQFDIGTENFEKIAENTFKANLLKPEVWKDVIDEAERSMTGGELGTLVFASALNILLFSPTYKESNIENIKNLLKKDKKRTYIASVSTSAFREDIRRWESVADNLMFARMGEGMKLFLDVERMENEDVSLDEVQVPIEKVMLEEIKEVAEEVRKRRIPQLKKV